MKRPPALWNSINFLLLQWSIKSNYDFHNIGQLPAWVFINNRKFLNHAVLTNLCTTFNKLFTCLNSIVLFWITSWSILLNSNLKLKNCTIISLCTNLASVIFSPLFWLQECFGGGFVLGRGKAKENLLHWSTVRTIYMCLNKLFTCINKTFKYLW